MSQKHAVHPITIAVVRVLVSAVLFSSLVLYGIGYPFIFLAGRISRYWESDHSTPLRIVTIFTAVFFMVYSADTGYVSAFLITLLVFVVFTGTCVLGCSLGEYAVKRANKKERSVGVSLCI